MIIFSMPSVALASGMLISDRLVGTNFFNAYEHGDALLWQHLFWFFGHPEVYIIFLPATGLRQRHHRDLLPPAGVRPRGRRAGADLDRHPRLRAVGPPHVRDRAAAGRLQFLHRGKHDGVDTDRPADLLLAGDDVGRPAALRRADALRHRLHHHLRDRRPHRRDDRRGPARPAAPRHLLRRRPFPLRADRRRGVPAARDLHLLVSPRSPAG